MVVGRVDSEDSSMSTVPEQRHPHAGLGLALTVVTTLGGVLTIGFFSGIPIVIAWAAITRARRDGDSTAIWLSWVALGFAVLGAAFSYWLWQRFLWNMHYHPGGGGPLAAPITLALAAMPLIAAGIGLAALFGFYLMRRVLARRSAHPAS
jgi:hypothetical protein